jgi:CRISPR type III-A-associated protein Csm2
MIPEAMEERLAKEWRLKTAKDILEKIFEDYHQGDKLTQILQGEKLIVCSYALGQILASFDVGLKASQLRRFYESLLQMKALSGEASFKEKVLPSLLMLKPQLANAKARMDRQIGPFFKVVNPLFDVIQDAEDLTRLCNFVQAIVAYHKYCGGRD